MAKGQHYRVFVQFDVEGAVDEAEAEAVVDKLFKRERTVGEVRVTYAGVGEVENSLDDGEGDESDEEWFDDGDMLVLLDEDEDEEWEDDEEWEG